MIGNIKINSSGIVDVNCQITNHHRYSGYTGQLAIGFYDENGLLIHQMSWNKGLNARGGGKNPKSAGIGSGFELPHSVLASFQTVEIVVRHDSKNPALRKMVDVFKISKNDIKSGGKKLGQALKDINVFDSDSSIRRRLAEIDPWEAAKLGAYVQYKRRYLSRVQGQTPFRLKPDDIHYQRLINARDQSGQPLYSAAELQAIRWYFDANTFGRGAQVAVTFGYDVLLNESKSDDARLTQLMAHEAVHSRQFMRDGEETFGKRYVSDSIKGLPEGIAEWLSGKSFTSTIHDSIGVEQEANRIERQWVDWWNREGHKQTSISDNNTMRIGVLKPPINLASRQSNHLGITGSPVSHGVVIERVFGSVANELGLEQGDTVVSIDKQPTRTVADIDQILERAKSRDGRFEILVRNVRFGREAGAQEYVRDYGKLPGALPPPSQQPLQNGNSNSIGSANIRSFDTRLGINGQATRSGVHVASVEPGSVAQRIGLSVGDIVTQIDGTNVFRPDQVLDALVRVANHRNGQFTIRILRQYGQVQELQTHLNQRER